MELELLGAAIASDWGLEVQVATQADTESLRRRLYKARSENPEFQSLSFVVPSSPTPVVWIVKQGGKDA